MNPKIKCAVCGEEFEQRDIRKPEKVCNKMMCRKNWEYRKKHMDPRDGSYPKIDEIGKW